jgi:hypothetical protein
MWEYSTVQYSASSDVHGCYFHQSRVAAGFVFRHAGLGSEPESLLLTASSMSYVQ